MTERLGNRSFCFSGINVQPFIFISLLGKPNLRRINWRHLLVKQSKLFLIIMFILPWFSIPLLGKKTVKRFWPACLFIAIVVRLESIIAKKRRWWYFYEKIIPNTAGEFPLIWGPFFIGSMWILKFTYGKFWIYTITNFVIDTAFTFPFVSFLEKFRIASLIQLKKYQLSILFFIKSLLLYGFQSFKEKR